jgi:hypothetical protein
MLVKYKETLISQNLLIKPSNLKIRKSEESGRAYSKDNPDEWLLFSEAQKQNHDLLYEDWVKIWKN